MNPREAMLDGLRRPPAELASPLAIPTVTGMRVDAQVTPPGSKSLTNRALLLAALASGTSTIRGGLMGAEDSEHMVAAVTTLGATVRQSDGVIEVDGVGGSWRPRASPALLHVGNAGTAMRFLAAAALRSPEPVTLDGDPRMRERPIQELGDALTRLGAGVEYLGGHGRPPLRITAPPEPGGSIVELGTTQSGQFISALLLVGPWLPSGITLRLRGAVTSKPYVAMTLALLSRLGASVRSSDDLSVMRVLPEPVAAFDYTVEPDATGATYWWGAAALLPGSCLRVPGLGAASLQGDARFVDLLEEMGAGIEHLDEPASVRVCGPQTLRPISADLGDMPDAAMTLAAAACFAGGSSVLRGLRTLRVKETDRLAALQVELTKLGVRVEVGAGGDTDSLTITPPPRGIEGDDARVEFNTYGDHRMAMALALIGLRRRNVFIRDPACVAKTYPGFWHDLAGVIENAG